MVVRETFKPVNASFPGPQARGLPKRPDLTTSAAYTMGPRSRIPQGLYVFSDDPPPDRCDWAEYRNIPGPGDYRPQYDTVRPSSQKTDFAPPIHWGDEDGIPALDLLRKYRLRARRELYTSGSEVRTLLRESLAPSARKARSETEGSYKPTLPSLNPRGNASTLRTQSAAGTDQLARSWHAVHRQELMAQERACPPPPRERHPPPFGLDIKKGLSTMDRMKAADAVFLTSREVREHSWDCRSIRHPRPATVYTGRIGSPG